MKILALDTSTEACSVALTIDSKITEEYILEPQSHATRILPMIETLLAGAETSLASLDAIAFSNGPGSFTGLRIGASIVQGIAFAHDLPVITISTLLSLAAQAYRTKNIMQIIPAIDARMSEVYWAIFEVDTKRVQLKSDEFCTPLDNIIFPRKGDWIGVGDGWRGVEKNREHFSIDTTILYSRAYDVASLAIYEFEEGNLKDPSLALPNYLREGHYKKSKTP